MNSFNKFAKTKDGLIHGVFSENTEEKTYNLVRQRYWLTSGGLYEAGSIISDEYPESEILVIDTNLTIVKNFKASEKKQNPLIKIQDNGVYGLTRKGMDLNNWKMQYKGFELSIALDNEIDNFLPFSSQREHRAYNRLAVHVYDSEGIELTKEFFNLGYFGEMPVTGFTDLLETMRGFKDYADIKAVVEVVRETGNIPSETKCPFRFDCELADGCHRNQVIDHDYSCAAARSFLFSDKWKN